MGLDKEIWKPVVGYEGLYEVSNLGRVKSLPMTTYHVCRSDKQYPIIRSERIRKQTIRESDGYCSITSKLTGKAKILYIHRLVAKAFIPNPNNKPCVNHINGIKSDNRVENLEWCTARENVDHKVANNLQPKGQFVHNAKLSDSESLKIYNSPLKVAQLSSIYNVSQSTVFQIKSKNTWKHIHAA